LFDTCSVALGQGTRPSRRNVVRAEATRDHEGSLRGARVLLVEDNEINQELAIELLGRVGIAVTVAGDGRQALDALQRERFDGVLMDCQMPVMDGYAATRALRQRAELKEMPVIAMTANAMSGDREKALAAGMDDHIVKPIDIDAMFATMARWIKPAPAAAVHHAERGHAPDLPPLPGVDIAVGLARANGSRALYARLLKMFLKNNADLQAQWEAAEASGDAAGAMRLAHTLKATAASLGVVAVERAAADLEQACATNAGTGVTRPRAATLFRVLEPVLGGLSVWQEAAEAEAAEAAAH
jgi:CheY-like chemotaxis protein